MIDWGYSVRVVALKTVYPSVFLQIFIKTYMSLTRNFCKNALKK